MADQFTHEDLKHLLEDTDTVYHENASHIILKCCPNCNGEDKLFVDKRNLLWQCFKCKAQENETAKGNLYLFLVLVLGLDKNQAKTLVFEKRTIEYKPETIVMPVQKAFNPVEEKKEIVEYDISPYFYKLDCSKESMRRFPEAYYYLFSRKVFSKSQIQSFDLRYNALHKRLIFPIYIEKDFMVGVQARDITQRYKLNHPKCADFKCSLFREYYFIGEKPAPERCPACNGELLPSFYPKATNSKNIPKTELFFNQQNVDWNKPVVLVEGPFDCISTPNSLGLLGRTLSTTQFFILIRNIKSKLILFLDGDSAGTFSTLDVYYKLYPFVNIEVCILYNEDDPGSHPLEENIESLKSTITVQEWAIKKNIML